MVAPSLLTTLLLALAVVAHPVVRSSPLKRSAIVRRVSTQTGPHNLVQQDRQRIRSLKARAKGIEARDAVISSPATHQAVSYIASVGVGSPATQYDLTIDTASSNTWVGAGTAYAQTSTSHQTADTVSVSYGSGSFNGIEFMDQVTIADGLVIGMQSIGVAKSSTGFDGVDGVIGVGPTDLTVGTLSPDTKSPIPTVTDNLFTTGTIPANMLGISFEPITSTSDTNGELTWGGANPEKYTGQITYAPITGSSPANTFWGIDASVTYGVIPLLAFAPGIVDTGTTLVQLATEAFQIYQAATGGVPDSNTRLLKITSAQYANLQSLFFIVSGVTFEFTANAQIWPRALNSLIGGTADGIYLIVTDIGSQKGAGLDFILGQTFLERFYSVYDTGNQRVGLATTSFTDATSN